MKKTKKQIMFRCPRCEYLLSPEQIKYAWVDYKCPRCEEINISNFKKVELIKFQTNTLTENKNESN